MSDGENIKVEDAISDVKRWFSQHYGRWLLIFTDADLTKNEEDMHLDLSILNEPI